MSEQAQRDRHSTLAQVQPGGRVRLATVPFDRAHDLLGDAYNAGTHGIGYSQQAMELHDAIIPAQPSPATCKEGLQVQQPAAAMADTQAVKLARASAFAHCNQHPYLPQTHEQANSWQPHEWVVAAIHTAALIASQPVGRRFQADVGDWMEQCFLPSLYSNMTERGDRLLEEVLELLQAHGYDSARVPTLVNYVFGRPVGEPAQEVGGVMVTLAAYCSVAGLSMQADGQAELDRINQPEVMARIRAKQEAKNALHFDTPLPGNAVAPAQLVGSWQMPHGIRLVEIPRRNGLDPINVFVQDYELGRGRIVVTCYGRAWCGFWGAMGDRTVMQFVAACDADYVAGNMLSGRHEHVKKHERLYVERIATEVIAEFRALIDSQAVGNG
ncbi:TPA: hypothetical protein ACOEPG_002822 [Stenotrophomonas maltophilia]